MGRTIQPTREKLSFTADQVTIGAITSLLRTHSECCHSQTSPNLGKEDPSPHQHPHGGMRK